MPLDGQTFVLPDLDFDERVRQNLRDAADCIERLGWCQEQLHSLDGRVCLMGALVVTTTSIPVEQAALGRMDQFLSRCAVTWNDTPGRTQAEVVFALRKAAEI